MHIDDFFCPLLSMPCCLCWMAQSSHFLHELYIHCHVHFYCVMLLSDILILVIITFGIFIVLLFLWCSECLYFKECGCLPQMVKHISSLWYSCVSSFSIILYYYLHVKCFLYCFEKRKHPFSIWKCAKSTTPCKYAEKITMKMST